IPGDIVHGEFNNLESARALVDDNTCAIMVEPVQGEGGILPADPEFLAGLRQLADAHDALLIFDEVQCGMGRTGHLYAYMDYGVTPDILSTAKALGGGFPIGAMLTTDKVGEVFVVGTHGSTYGGNPLACAVSLAAITHINQPEVLEGVGKRAAIFREELDRLNEKDNCFTEIRGKGLLIGAELNERFEGKGRAALVAGIEQ